MMVKQNEYDARDIIENKIEEYKTIMNDLRNQKELDNDLLNRYTLYIYCLSDLQHKLSRNRLFSTHIVYRLLENNYEKFDTEVKFVDGTSVTIAKDDICGYDDDCIIVYPPEAKKDRTIVHPPKMLINLDNVKFIETLS